MGEGRAIRADGLVAVGYGVDVLGDQYIRFEFIRNRLAKSSISRALDYRLKRSAALSRYLNDGAVSIDNNWADTQTGLGRKNWLFAGSLRSGKRAVAVMSLIQSARLNGHDPYACLKDVFTRLPTERASEIDQKLSHKCKVVKSRKV